MRRDPGPPPQPPVVRPQGRGSRSPVWGPRGCSGRQMPSNRFSLFSVGRQWQGCGWWTGRRAAPACNAAALPAWEHTASGPQPHSHWLRRRLPALGKQQSLQIYCWRAKPSSVGSARVPHCRPLWAWGFKLPQRSWLPEQEAGDQAGGQGPGTLSGTPRPGVAVSCGASGSWGPCAGMEPPSCSPRKPRLHLPSSEAPPAPASPTEE